jgi:hypothetical protein
MQTYSHWLLTAALQRHLKTRSEPNRARALLAGSVVPDLPLALLTLGYLLDRRYLRPHLPDKERCSPTFNHLYFHNRWWIAAHNSLHAPLPVALLLLGGYLWRRTGWGRRLFWFALGCGLHTAVDIPTHVDDGPVLFFPLNWQYRLPAPVSYWDPQHGGRLFWWLEHLLDLLLVFYLIGQWCRGQRHHFVTESFQ